MPMKKNETPLQGYLSSIVAFIIATTVGMMVFSIASHHAADQLAQRKLTSNISRQSIHFEEILECQLPVSGRCCRTDRSRWRTHL